MSKATDIYEHVTEYVIRGLESGDHGTWTAPWHGGIASLPTNAMTKRGYRGGNTVALWVESLIRGYESPWWATYRQWGEHLGAQVRKGERATHCVKWVEPKAKDKAKVPASERRSRLIPIGFAVFNASQVDGWTPPEERGPEVPPIEHAEAFFAAIGAKRGRGAPAYSPFTDVIDMPALRQFRDAEAYYATFAHEHVHWTGHKSRLNRELSVRFGDEAYAFEELVAEIGSAFVAAHLGIEVEPRADHVAYVASWIKVLRDDAKNLYNAAALAQKACDYLLAAAGEVDQADDDQEDAA